MSHALGLASAERLERTIQKKEAVQKIRSVLTSVSLEPGEMNPFLLANNSVALTQKQKAIQILLRPDIELKKLIQHATVLNSELGHFSMDEVEQAEIQIKYEVYIEKEKELVKRMNQLEELEIPESFDYEKLNSLSMEARQKFTKIKPRTLGQASRISGVNPSDVQILMVYMGR